MRDESRAIQSSVWTIRLALFSLAIVVLTIVFHRIFGMGTLVALNLFKIAFAGSVAVLLIGTFALVRIWQRGWRGGSNAVTGMVLAAVILAWPLSIVPQLRSHPVINDISTDLKNPPQFVVLKGKRPKGANPMVYPGESFARQQTRAYRDIGPITVDRSARETLELCRQAMRKMKMTVAGVVAMDARGAGWGQVEAVDRTLVLGFYDDVIVRVTRVRGGSLVDIRSASRFGRSDLGRNADRIREFHTELVARVQATVPASNSRSGDGGRKTSSNKRQR